MAFELSTTKRSHLTVQRDGCMDVWVPFSSPRSILNRTMRSHDIRTDHTAPSRFTYGYWSFTWQWLSMGTYVTRGGSRSCSVRLDNYQQARQAGSGYMYLCMQGLVLTMYISPTFQITLSFTISRFFYKFIYRPGAKESTGISQANNTI